MDYHMEYHKSQSERKFLVYESLLYINNNSSFHHMGVCVHTRTRTRETPPDELRDCGIRSEPQFTTDPQPLSSLPAGPVLASCRVHSRSIGLVANCSVNRVRRPLRGSYASVPIWQSRARQIGTWKNRNTAITHAGTIANLEKVLFVGPDVKRGVM